MNGDQDASATEDGMSSAKTATAAAAAVQTDDAAEARKKPFDPEVSPELAVNGRGCPPLKIVTCADGDHLASMMSKLNLINSKGSAARHGAKEEEDDDDSGQEDDDDDYIERGPMINGRLTHHRGHPYEHNGGSSDARSVSSGVDSESSSSSSPEVSPQHSFCIQIPSRHYYGPVGMVTVFPPSPQQGGHPGESPPPLRADEIRRNTHRSGGGLVTEEAPSPGLLPLTVSQASVPMVTVDSVEIQPPPPPPPHAEPAAAAAASSSSSQVSDFGCLSLSSPFGSYRDCLGHSPVSVCSFADESTVGLQPSPESDASQLSPLGFDWQEPGAARLLAECASLSAVADETLAVHAAAKSPLPLSTSFSDIKLLDRNDTVHKVESCPDLFAGISIEEVVQTFYDEDLGFPDKQRDFQDIAVVRDAAEPDTSKPLCEMQVSFRPAAQERFAVPSLPPCRSRRPSQPSVPVSAGGCKGSTAKAARPDIEAKVQERLSRYVPILPKVESSAPPVTTVAAALCDGHTVPLQASQPPSSATEFPDVVTAMREQFSDQERNRALATVDRMTVDELCSADDSGDTHLHIAICHRKLAFVYAIVVRLTSNNMSLDIPNKGGQTPLFVAVYINNPIVVEFLLYHGANPGCVCRDGVTPLHIVASGGDVFYNVACGLLTNTKLIEFGRHNRDGFTALHCAIQRHGQVGTLRIVQLLLKSGASLCDQESCSGKTALHLAVEIGCLEMVQALCENCRDICSAINAKTYVQDTPLHLAAMLKHRNEAEHLILLKLLLSFGAHAYLKNNDRKLPRDLVSSDKSQVFRQLLHPKGQDRSPTP